MNSTGVRARVLFPSSVRGGSEDTVKERMIYRKGASRYARLNGHVYLLLRGDDGYEAVCRTEARR